VAGRRRRQRLESSGIRSFHRRPINKTAGKDNENRNEYSAFVGTRRARGCRSIAVTGKRGHRVYASRDRRRREVEDVPVSCRGGRCTRLLSAGASRARACARGWLCIRAERGVSISRSHAHPGIVLVIVSSLGTRGKVGTR